MIVTCASCLTKYQLDDARISEKGAKVRCSRCKHVFYVVPPPETKEEVAENFESFAKYHEELIVKDQKVTGLPSLEDEEKEEVEKKEAAPVGAEEEDKFLFSDQPPQEQMESFSLPELEESKETTGLKEAGPKKVSIDERRMRGERKKPFRLFALIAVIVILVFGLFYLWTEFGSGGKFSSYLEDPLKKVTQLWETLWGIEKEGLVVKDLSGYEEKVGELSLYMIEGKVDNQSQKAKKLIKVKVIIFDQNRMKVAEKETLCGRTIGRGELKNLTSAFFSGEMLIQPNTENEMIAHSGKTIPFAVVFKDLPAQAKEFKVEIVAAPGL